MKIHCIGSSSSGNCYVIESLGQYLIVELGCAFKKVLAAIDWRVENVAGCLASHRLIGIQTIPHTYQRH